MKQTRPDCAFAIAASSTNVRISRRSGGRRRTIHSTRYRARLRADFFRTFSAVFSRARRNRGEYVFANAHVRVFTRTSVSIRARDHQRVFRTRDGRINRLADISTPETNRNTSDVHVPALFSTTNGARRTFRIRVDLRTRSERHRPDNGGSLKKKQNKTDNSPREINSRRRKTTSVRVSSYTFPFTAARS